MFLQNIYPAADNSTASLVNTHQIQNNNKKSDRNVLTTMVNSTLSSLFLSVLRRA